MRQFFTIFLLFVGVFITPVNAQSAEEIVTGLNLLGGLSQSGESWSGVGAYFSTPPLLETSNSLTIGTYHRISCGESGIVKLSLGDPENRARSVRWEIVNSQTAEIQTGEVECQDSRIVEIPIQFSTPGIYYMHFFLISKLRGQEQFLVFRWNEAKLKTTASSGMMIFVESESSSRSSISTTPNSANSNVLNLEIDGQNFGSAPSYYVSGLEQMKIRAGDPQDWTVSGPEYTQDFSGEESLVFRPENPGTWIFQSRDDQIMIIILAVSRAEAEATSDININYCTNGNMTVDISSRAYAYAESVSLLVVACFAQTEEVNIQELGWSGVYQPQLPVYSLGVPGQYLHWNFNPSSSQWEQQDPTCGPPPDDWGWQPPVPPPPSDGWAPEVPPVP